MASTPDELLDELDELVTDFAGHRAPSVRVPSRSVARALRLRASARKRAAGFQARARAQHEKLLGAVERLRMRATGSGADRN